MTESTLPSNTATTSPVGAACAPALPAWEVAQSLRAAGRCEEALQILRHASTSELTDYRLHEELGTTLSELDRHEEAIGSLIAALQLNPNCLEVPYKIGLAFCARGMFRPAVEWFYRARQIDATTTKYLYSYGKALIAIGCLKLAADIFDRWIEAEPDNPIASHLSRAALGSREISRASNEYVCRLFDGCALRFDETLARLQYRGPQLVLSALDRAGAHPSTGWEVLDLGCGTGLVGAALRPFARHLVGVDLSRQMLELARQRQEYDELIEAEIVEYLREAVKPFDVVTASDVLTYLGDLGEFFENAVQVLKPGGLIAVVVESLEDDTAKQAFRLNPTGRFSHAAGYLQSVMERSGLTVACFYPEVMRWEASSPVPSLVAVGRVSQHG